MPRFLSGPRVGGTDVSRVGIVSSSIEQAPQGKQPTCFENSAFLSAKSLAARTSVAGSASEERAHSRAMSRKPAPLVAPNHLPGYTKLHRG
jgi:hypothetical protein